MTTSINTTSRTRHCLVTIGSLASDHGNRHPRQSMANRGLRRGSHRLQYRVWPAPRTNGRGRVAPPLDEARQCRVVVVSIADSAVCRPVAACSYRSAPKRSPHPVNNFLLANGVSPLVTVVRPPRRYAPRRPGPTAPRGRQLEIVNGQPEVGDQSANHSSTSSKHVRVRPRSPSGSVPGRAGVDTRKVAAAYGEQSGEPRVWRGGEPSVRGLDDLNRAGVR